MQTLTRRTDIYSWGLCVLEMFLGKRLWDLGMLVGGKSSEKFLAEKMRAPMSKDMKELLRRCLKESPIRRFHDFAEIEEELLRQYEAATGRIYPRANPRVPAATLLDAGEKPQKKRGRPKKNTNEKAELSQKKEETPSQSAAKPFDPTGYNEPSKMTELRRASIEDLCAEMDEDFERGDLSREEMLAIVEESYNKPSGAFERSTLRELYRLYKPIELLTIDDEGRYHDFKESYILNGEPFCCCYPMEKIKKGIFQCRFCGNTYKETSASKGATAPKKIGHPKKSENKA